MNIYGFIFISQRPQTAPIHPARHEDGNNFMGRRNDCRLNGGQLLYILMALSALCIYNMGGFARITAARRCHINLTLLSEDSDSRGLADSKSNRGCAYGGK